MSLINEALKRAKHAQKKEATAPPPASSAALRPIKPMHPGNHSPKNLLPLVFVVLVAVGGCIVWFALRSGSTFSTPQTVVRARSATTIDATAPKPEPKPTISQPVPAASQPIAQPSPPVVLANVSPAPTAPAPVSAQAQSAPAQSVTAAALTPTAIQPAVVASAPPAPPAMPKLQGIFYRPQRPAALLDGRMVLIGRTVGEYRVVDISQQSVTVVRAGQTNVLSLPD